MKKLVILFLSLSIFAEGKVGNGGDLSTRTLIYAADNLSRYIAYCFEDQQCALDKEQERILRAIDTQVLSNYQASALLVFVSNDTTGLFYQDGIEKVAITGDIPGEKIYINTKRLKSYSNYEAIALLVHELGHQVGQDNHSLLDMLGVRFSTQVRHYSKSSGRFIDPFIQGSIYFEDQWSGDASVITEQKVINIKNIISKNLSCPIINDSSLVVRQDIKILNVYQDEFSFFRGKRRVIPLTAWVSERCFYKNSGSGRFAHRINIELEFYKKGLKYLFDESRTRVKVNRIGK